MKKITILCIILLSIGFAFADTFISLEEAISLAMENNHSLKSYYNEMHSARWSVINSKTQFLPKVNFLETAIFFDEERLVIPEMDFGLITIPEVKQDKRAFISTLQVEQILFAGGRIYNSGKIADINYQISKNNYDKQLQELSVKVTEHYYQILKIKSALEILHNHKSICEDIRANAEVLYNNGIGLETDIMQWDLQLIEIENQLIQTESALRLLYDSWDILLGIKGKFRLSKPDIQAFESIKAEIKNYYLLSDIEKNERMKDFIASLRKSNYDFDNLNKSHQSLNYLSKIAKADFMPSIFLSFNYEIENDKRLDFKGADNWQIMANVSIPLFHSGRNYSQYKSQRYKIQSQKNLIEESLQGIEILAKQAWYDFENSVNSFMQAERSYYLSERALTLSRALYAQGMLTNTALTEAQNNSQNNHLLYVGRLYDYIIHKNNLSKFTGGVK